MALSKQSKGIGAAFVPALFLCILTSCTHDHITVSTGNTTPTDTTSTTNGAATVSFSKDVKPILVKYDCAGCHGSYYETYSGAANLAKTGKLYGVLSGTSGYIRMPPNSILSASELKLIKTWVTEGEKNN